MRFLANWQPPVTHRLVYIVTTTAGVAPGCTLFRQRYLAQANSVDRIQMNAMYATHSLTETRCTNTTLWLFNVSVKWLSRHSGKQYALHIWSPYRSLTTTSAKTQTTDILTKNRWNNCNVDNLCFISNHIEANLLLKNKCYTISTRDLGLLCDAITDKVCYKYNTFQHLYRIRFVAILT